MNATRQLDAPAAAALAEPARWSLPLRVDGSGAGPQPVTLGVPFAKGTLVDGKTILWDAEEREVPVQTTPLSRWSDGSVRWLLLDFVVDGPAEGASRWALRPAGEVRTLPASRLVVEDTDQAVVIRTGAAVFHVDRQVFRPFTRVQFGGRDLLQDNSCRTVLTDAKGGTELPRIDSIAVEASGPVRATVCLQGSFAGRVRCRFEARLCFWAGTGLVRLRLTLHNPNRARHAGGLWDLGDPGSLLFRDLSLEAALAGPDAPEVRWTADSGEAPRALSGDVLEVYQDSSGGENWRSRNHVNRDGRVPCSFRGYRVRDGRGETFGLRASPVVSLRGPAGTVTVAVPEFWQQFPKALEVDRGTLRVRLFPRQFGDLFELQGGEQKTHTVWLHFGPAGERSGLPLQWVHRPARAQAPPEWYVASGAVPDLPLPSPDGGRLERLLTEAVAGPNSFFARREVIDEYGYRHYGEVYADHEASHYDGPPPLVSHYNNQYDVVHGALRQYWRTGDPRWFDLLDPLARHVRDIDVYHTTRDRAAYSGGLFWHTDHYRDAATATHRAYARANRRPGRSYGGGPSNEHNYTTGLLHYSFVTGDPGARDAVLRLADWVLAMDDGRRNVFGLLDDGPTGLASSTASPAYHGPGRGAGNSVNALLDAWLLTGQRHYLDYAEALVRRCVHPADDVTRHDLLNVEARWSYTVFLVVLARYLDLKAEAGEQDSMFRYARAALLRYAAWMVVHEEPYFDHPEKLEYPTETWAAQELRKANVFRLAARYAPEPLHGRLLQCGEAFAERAWRDLLGFESRTVTRALALVLSEGTRDAALRSCPPPPAAPVEDETFPPPETFVPQRQRIRAMLKTPGGLVRALARLANVNNWMRFLAARRGG
jgi:hypothetical protein